VPVHRVESRNRTSRRKCWEQFRGHLRGEFLEQANRSCDARLARVHQPQIEGVEVPFRHDLDEQPVADQGGLYQRRKIANASSREQSSGKTSVVIHRQMRVERQRLLPLPVHEIPGIRRLPKREREQAMLEEVPRFLGRLAARQISRTCDELVPVRQDLPRDEGRVFQLRVNPKRQINALGNLIDDPIGDEHLDANVRVGRLECADQGRQQRIGDARWRGKP